MRFEPDTSPSLGVCETCKFIASQVDGAVTALDAFEGAVRSRDARIAALEAERDQGWPSPELTALEATRVDLAAARARISALEAERDRADFSQVVELREKVAALEAERDKWRSAHNGQKAQVAMLEAYLASEVPTDWKIEGEKLRARVAGRKAASNFTPAHLIPWDQINAAYDKAVARVAELEAERDGTVRMLDVSQLILNEKMERIAALEAERNRLREALSATDAYFGACSAPVAIKVRAALAGEEQP